MGNINLLKLTFCMQMPMGNTSLRQKIVLTQGTVDAKILRKTTKSAGITQKVRKNLWGTY